MINHVCPEESHSPMTRLLVQRPSFCRDRQYIYIQGTLAHVNSNELLFREPTDD